MVSTDVKYRIVILNNIFKEFHFVIQDLETSMGKCITEHLDRAEVLVETLEVIDCGSIGGFDYSNGMDKFNHYTLWERFLFLCKKYNNFNDIKDVCGYGIEDIDVGLNKLYSGRELCKRSERKPNIEQIMGKLV